MALEYELIQEDGIDQVKFLSMFDPDNPGDEIKQLASRLRSRLRLYEFDAAWDPTAGEIRSIASLAGKYVNIPDSRVAVVADTELVFGLVRMYASYRETNPDIPELEVFRSRDEALQWLESCK